MRFKQRTAGSIVTVTGVISAFLANYSDLAWIGIFLVFIGALMIVFSFPFFNQRRA